jgi:predicted nucleic acid-binding protein
MYLIDTNIHAAYILQGYENDETTKQYLNQYRKIALSDRVVPDFILGEFETFITRVAPPKYHLNAEDAEKLQSLAFDYIKQMTNEFTLVTPDVQTIQNASGIFFANCERNYLSFNDCMLLATAKQNSFTVFTKDKPMSKLAKKLQISIFDLH